MGALTVLVNLLPHEIEEANAWGRRLYERARDLGFDGYGSDPGKRLMYHQIGARCEKAFAVFRGVRWSPGINDFKDEPDVDGFEVRGTRRLWGPLRISERDHDRFPYALVLEEFGGWYRMAGWIRGKEGKRKKWLQPKRESWHQAWYFVPQDALHFPFPVTADGTTP